MGRPKKAKNLYGDSEMLAILRRINSKTTISATSNSQLIPLLLDLKKEIIKMAKTLAEVMTAITELGTAIDADVEQDKVVVTAVNALIEKLKNIPPGTVDLTAEVDAVLAATSKLSADNAAVQAALDSAAGA